MQPKPFRHISPVRPKPKTFHAKPPVKQDDVPWLTQKPVWQMFECDNGCRWTQVVGSVVSGTAKDGDTCYFSGCKPDHKIHSKGYTADRDEAHDWFRNVHLEKKLGLIEE